MVTIRTVHKTWIANPVLAQPTQLFLLLPEVRLPIARALDREPKKPRKLPPRNPSWVVQSLGADVADDPEICPTLPQGQMALLVLPRTFTLALAGRIADRTRRRYTQINDEIATYTVELGNTTGWRGQLRRITGLLLAASEAEGLARVPQRWVSNAPLSDAVREVLTRHDLLDLSEPSPQKTLPKSRSCEDCGSWGVGNGCVGCLWWRKVKKLGTCSRCRRSDLPVDSFTGRTLCRSCFIVMRERSYISDFEATADDYGETQLSFGGVMAVRINIPAGVMGYRPPHSKAKDFRRRHRPPPPPFSEHIVNPAQYELFSVVRDWSAITPSVILPTLTPKAQHVVASVSWIAVEKHWHPQSQGQVIRTLRILLSWLGADAPIREDDVRALQSVYETTTVTRTLVVLEEHQLLEIRQHKTADERWVERNVAALQEGMGTEIATWIDVMRGRGRRRRKQRSWRIIRRYLEYSLPVIESWSTHHESLREISRHQVQEVLKGRAGTRAHGLRTGLRSIFAALKQERILFRDPTRGVTLSPVVSVPISLQDSELRGLIDRGASPLDRLILALVAIHALNTREIRAMKLVDIDFARRKLTTQRRGIGHVVHLDATTARLFSEWMKYRTTHWPMSPNPHILITAPTAFRIDHPSMGHSRVHRAFSNTGFTPRQVRMDRVLYEASVTGDPLHLMKVFGISGATALNYVRAAYPERGSTIHGRGIT